VVHMDLPREAGKRGGASHASAVSAGRAA
jgi:hypothetical protein